MRVKMDNIEREIPKELLNKYLEDNWKEIQTDYENLKVNELKTLAASKGIEFEPAAKKEELIQLLEGAN